MNLENLLLGDYLKELGKYLIDTFDKRQIIYNCIYDEISVSAKLSVPCGLLLNELITNSLKYAFDKTYSPMITLHVKRTEDDKVTFIYKDNGTGLPNDFDIEKASTLGILLIKQLVIQLEGDFQISSKDEFVFQTTFKVPKS
jgi:two-component sensor histidine kinase